MKIPGKQHRLAPTWGRAVWVGATSELCVLSVRLPLLGEVSGRLCQLFLGVFILPVGCQSG